MSIHESKGATVFNIVLHGLRKYLKFRFITILSGVMILVLTLILMITIPTKYTTTTDISDYGIYGGTCSDSFVSSYINSFFPDKIAPSFSNIRYSYKAENTDSYGFEAYLEFQIEDKALFEEYISTVKQDRNFQTSSFCSGFQECNIENALVLDLDDDTDSAGIFYMQIDFAKIRKILYSPETQTIIYVAIGVYDGGGIGTNYLNAFFDRFQIDPAVYMKTADSQYGVNPYGID